MRHGSLFSGIGGFDLAAEWMGWENVFHCEWNPFCQKLLKQHFPESEGHGDITTTDFTKYANTIDVLTGGFPCQPFSGAGEQRGEADERYLFGEMFRAIREIKPPWIVAENVYGITDPKFKSVFTEIYSSLEAEGYKVQAYNIPASAIEAEHKRERIWFVAYSYSKRLQIKRKSERLSKKEGEALPGIKRTNVMEPKLWSSISGDAESIVCRKGHGIPNRVDRIKALGNAIVPQVAYEIFKAIEQVE